jgi:putative peptidoglycan lipid II flippase
MLLKAVSILGSLTFLSRILGYVRDLLIAKIIGAGLVSDAFFISFKLPNLFRRLLAEGSMNSAFIPVIAGILKKSKFGADEFFSKIFSLLVTTLFILLLIFEIFMPLIIKLIAPGFGDDLQKFSLTVDLSRLAFPFVIFICLTSLAGAYLNTLGKFAAMALTPVILNLSLIFCLLFFFNSQDSVLASNFLSATISIAGSIQLIWILINLKKNKINFKWKLPTIKEFKAPSSGITKFLNLLFPVMIGNGAYQLNLLIDMILASTLTDGSISYLYYADRINQLPLGVLGIALSTALLPLLSKYVKSKNTYKINQTISQSIKLGIFFSIPAFFGIFFLSDHIIGILFLRGEFNVDDVNLTGSALSALAFGLPSFILIKILAVPFFANEDTKTPIKISIVSISVNLVFNLILIRDFQHVGLAMATAISAWANAILLFYVLSKKFNYRFDKTIFMDFIKIVLSSLIMIVSIILIMNLGTINFTVKEFSGTNELLVLTAIFFGGIIYFLMSYIFGIRYIDFKKWKTKN